ncbi:MAG: fibronectin type III domain-containing protein, partial [Ilumatobacteraceae bacterium]
MRCWGLFQYSSTGFHTGTYPTDAVDVTVGSDFACYLSTTGTVGCWGNGEALQLGNTSYLPFYRSTPYMLPFSGAVSISAGGRHTCAVLASGNVWCWGTNRWGELGNGRRSTVGVWGEPPSQVLGVNDAVAVAVGSSHSCVLRRDTTVYCWGINYNGQLGNGILGYSDEPQQVVGIDDAVDVSSGSEAVCAVRATGTVECWGENSFQQLGDGTTVSRDLAAPAIDVTNAVRVSVGELHACAVLADGGVRCWGSSANGRIGSLGPQSTTVYPTSPPIAVPEITNAVEVVAGYRHTCALLTDGTVSCWGSQSALPDPPNGTAYPPVGVPMPVPNLYAVQHLWSPGNDATCAIGADQNGNPVRRCWGWIAFLYQNSFLPEVGSARSFSYYRSAVKCDLRTGTIWCEGDNLYGQLGLGISALLPTGAPSTKVSGSKSVRFSVGIQTAAEPTRSALDGIGLFTTPHRVSNLAVTTPPGYRQTFGGTTTTSGTTTSSTTAGTSPTTGNTSPTTGGSSTTNASSTTLVAALASATPGNRSARVSWPGDAWPTFGSVTAFQIQRSSDGGKTWRAAATVGKVRRTHIVVRLANGVNYQFRVRPIRGRATGDWIGSNDVTPRTVPSQPRLVRATPGNGTLLITWLTPLSNGGAPLLEYRVQTSTNGRSWSAPTSVEVGATASNSTTIEALANGVKVYVRVVAVNAAGASRGT